MLYTGMYHFITIVVVTICRVFVESDHIGHTHNQTQHENKMKLVTRFLISYARAYKRARRIYKELNTTINDKCAWAGPYPFQNRLQIRHLSIGIKRKKNLHIEH